MENMRKQLCLALLLLITFISQIQSYGFRVSPMWDSSEEMLESKEFSSKEYYKISNDAVYQKAKDVSLAITKELEQSHNENIDRKETKFPYLSIKRIGNPVSDHTKSQKNDSLQKMPNMIKRQIAANQISKENSIFEISTVDMAPFLSKLGSQEKTQTSLKEFKKDAINETFNSHIISDKFKRQTESLQRNGNSFTSLLTIPIKLDVMANVLSHLNQDVMGSKHKPRNNGRGSFHSKNLNEANSLVNVPIDVQAILNILAGTTNQEGRSHGLLGGLLGGVSGEKEGLLEGLLGGLGDTLDDVLLGLLGGGTTENAPGLLGGLLGSGKGNGLLEGLLGPLLDNLLGAVGNIVDNLLELLTALLNGLLKGLANGALKNDNSNSMNSLINIPIRINALINILSSVQQTMGKPTDPNGAKPHANGGSSSGGSLTQGDPRKGSFNLLNLKPDIDVDLNILSKITQIMKPPKGNKDGGNNNGNDSGNGSGNPNEICFDIPIKQSEPSSLVNVEPKINLDLNILSSLTQSGAGRQFHNGGTQRICIPLPTTPIPPAMPTTTAVTTTTPADEICFDVVINQSGTAFMSHNNDINSLINVAPKLNLNLNLLSQVKSESRGPTVLRTQRICIPTNPNTSEKPTTMKPTTTAKPRPTKRCFKRVCKKWRKTIGYSCSSEADHYYYLK